MYFIRNTHDEVGNPYPHVLNLSTAHQEFVRGLGVHALKRSGELTTFEEYRQEHYEYQKSWGDFVVPNDIVLLEDLVFLAKLGLVKVKFDD